MAIISHFPSRVRDFVAERNAMKYPREFAGLRGLAAAYVLVRHSFEVLPPSRLGGLLAQNAYAVKLFMIVSGFSIYWLLDTRRPTYGRFILGRAFRILPVYLVGLLASMAMLDFVRRTLADIPLNPWITMILGLTQAVQDRPAAHMMAHVTLLHGLVPDTVLPGAAITIVPHAWSLSLEWHLYLVMPFVIVWLSTLRSRRSRWCLLGLIAALLAVSPFLSPAFIGNNLSMISLGIACYPLAKLYRDHESYPAIMTLLFGLAAMWDVRDLPTIAVWFAGLYAATTPRQGAFETRVSGILCARPIQYLGRISYSFYIFHLLALFVCLRVGARYGVPDGLRYVALPLASVALSIVVADLAYRIIERPSHRLGTALTAPGRSQAERG